MLRHRVHLTPYTRLLAALCLGVLLSTAPYVQAENAPPPMPLTSPDQSEAHLAVFDEVWQTVQEKFYDTTLHQRDWQAVRERYRPLAATAASSETLSTVLNQMLVELGASHTRHYTPSEPAYYQLLDIFARGLRRDLRQMFPDGTVTYPGIGIFTQQRGDKTFVSGILAGLPAAKAGLLVGDELVTVAGEPYQPIHSFAQRVGQEVPLQIRRTATGPVQDLVVVPERLQPNAAFLSAMKDSAHLIERGDLKLGYIHIWSYAGLQYQQQLEHELATGALKDAAALILDLRDGWGGAQPAYLDLFNSRAPIMTIRDRQGSTSVDNFKWRKPVVMLINSGTRSGKEILAQGFKTYGLGELVGTRTAGAVLAGRAFVLRDRSLLLLAVADVQVDGQRLEGVGVTPTIEVPFSLEYAQGHDPQLARAVEYLTQALRG